MCTNLWLTNVTSPDSTMVRTYVKAFRRLGVPAGMSTAIEYVNAESIRPGVSDSG